MGSDISFAEAADLLKGARRALVISHYNPDADAYGSACGLTIGLRALGIDAHCVNEDGRSERYAYIPGLNLVESEVRSSDGWDIVVICDCGDLGRVGEKFKPVVTSARQVLNIDHHVSNPGYGTHNLVRDKASSTAELVFEILDLMPGALTVDAATCLYVGIVGDTGSFRYSSTSARTFEIAAKLVRLGVKSDKVAHAMFSCNPLASVRLQTEAMSGLKILFGGKAAEVVVTNEMYQRFGATREDADNLVERARDIEGVLVSILIKQDREIWRVSLRSSDAACNVSEIASSMGGGGHKMAAAFRWSKSLDELQAILHSKIEEMLRRV